MLRPLPQYIFLNLPRARLGELIHDFYFPRNHEPANGTPRPLSPLNDCFAGDRFPNGDISLRSLAPV